MESGWVIVHCGEMHVDGGTILYEEMTFHDTRRTLCDNLTLDLLADLTHLLSRSRVLT
jgi:hypothetical protein